MPRFAFVGLGGLAKTGVQNSPSYGAVPAPPIENVGIATLQLAADGHLTSEGLTKLNGKVNWIECHPRNGHVYAAFGEQVGAFSIGSDGSLKQVGSFVDSMGGVHHLTVSIDGAWLLGVGYVSRIVSVFPIKADGSLGSATDSKVCQAKLIPELADRQEQCHPHQIRVDPRGGQWALVCDLGADIVWVYSFDAHRGALRGALNSELHLKMPQGAGPRHLDFHPNGQWVYVLCELNCNVVTCDWCGDSGRLAQKHSVNMLADGVAPCRSHHSGACAIHIAQDGRTLYASTRGGRLEDSIVVFSVDALNGTLTRIQEVPCGGVSPREFHLDWASPEAGTKRDLTTADAGTKRCLRVGNQDTQSIATFGIAADGLLIGPPSVLSIAGGCPTSITAPITPPPWVASL